MSGFLSGAIGSLGGLLEQHGGSGTAGAMLSTLFDAAGGVPGIVSRFEQAGLGDKVQSWVGGGHNLPIDADELYRVFPPEQIEQFAAAHGVPAGVATQLLQHLLPHAVDSQTPNGRVEEAAPGGQTANPFGGDEPDVPAGTAPAGSGPGGGFDFGALAQRFLGGR
ncbi:MAG: DUF937 domain-containing protein [Gluconacetobacter diazotrophicus]|nr:DUF937 domain-containing protein [Gluconacetobacter diazotrophicus]